MKIVKRNGSWYKAIRKIQYERLQEIACAICNKKWLTKHAKSQTCSPKCRAKYRWSKMPPQVRYKHIHNGYVMIRPIGEKKYFPEHRYIMEKFLNRKLGRYEFVHHINGKRNDNRLENLIVLGIGDHNSHHKTEEAKNRGRCVDGKFH